MPTDIIIIHGGNSYSTHTEYLHATRTFEPRYKDGYQSWKTNLIGEMQGLYTVLNPIFPCQDNAKFEEWCIVFNKVLALCGDDIILIGHSLGANFLQTYLGQHIIEKNIDQLHFVAGCISEGDFVETINWTQVNQASKHIHIWHSDNDPVVPYEEAIYYDLKLKNAKLHTLNGKQHINQPYFPELSAHLINSALARPSDKNIESNNS